MRRALPLRSKRESVRGEVSKLYGALLALSAMKAELARLHTDRYASDIHRIARELDTVERRALSLLDALEARGRSTHH